MDSFDFKADKIANALRDASGAPGSAADVSARNLLATILRGAGATNEVLAEAQSTLDASESRERATTVAAAVLLTRAREALKGYGDHHAGCPASGLNIGLHHACDCGLDAALHALDCGGDGGALACINAVTKHSELRRHFNEDEGPHAFGTCDACKSLTGVANDAFVAALAALASPPALPDATEALAEALEVCNLIERKAGLPAAVGSYWPEIARRYLAGGER